MSQSAMIFSNSLHLIRKKNLGGRKSLHLNVSCHDCLNLDATCTQFFILEIHIPFHLLFLRYLQNEKEMTLVSIQILRIIKISKDEFIYPEHFWLKSRKHWKYWGRKRKTPNKKNNQRTRNQHNQSNKTNNQATKQKPQTKS